MNYDLIQGDCIQVMRTLPAGSVQMVCTSPPYFGLRSYIENGHADKPLEIGLEETPDAYIAKLVEVFREVKRLLHPTGVCWVNLGDSYSSGGRTSQIDQTIAGQRQGTAIRPPVIDGIKPKDLIGIPWMAAFALRADGWYLRSEIIWHKRAPMPESVTDRPTKAHEQVFLLTKSANYYYDAEAIAEQSIEASGWAKQRTNGVNTWKYNNTPERIAMTGQASDSLGFGDYGKRNRRSVWTLGPESYAGAHFATMPTKLVEPCILAGSKVGDTVLDPFSGSGTVVAVALKHGRNGIGIDLSAAYNEMAHRRIAETQPLLLAAD